MCLLCLLLAAASETPASNRDVREAIESWKIRRISDLWGAADPIQGSEDKLDEREWVRA